MNRSPQTLLAQLKALPATTTSRPGADDVRAMQARADQAELLYWLAGRHQPTPGRQGTFTGLMSASPIAEDAQC